MAPVDADDLDWETTDRSDAHFRRKRLADAADGDRLGCSLYELPPDGSSWPYHYHEGNEEAVYVLAGTGVLRTPDGEQSLTAGDYAAFPEGEAGAHRLHNESDEPLRFLAMSTMDDPDVTVYPDDDKLCVFGGAPPGGTGERTLSGCYRRGETVDYWE